VSGTAAQGWESSGAARPRSSAETPGAAGDGDTVVFTATPMPLSDLLRAARGTLVALSDDASAAIDRSREAVTAALASGEAVYGLNTGLGHMKDDRIEGGELRRYQEVTVLAHDGGIGQPLPTEVVRAAMAARVNGIARGGSGASRAVADALVAMLNSGVHPVVPSIGSVGASDLMHMASIALVAIGQGRAEFRGAVLGGAEALRRAGLTPLALAEKDALALLSANAVAVGHGALVVERATWLAGVADVVVACSLEAYRGNPSIVDPAVAQAKPIDGQRAAADHLRSLLAGSALFSTAGSPDGPRSIQDPLSFRVAPQVHGALREFVGVARHAVETELNAMGDNPLVAAGRMIHNGNFQPMVLALAFDALRPALGHVGGLSERRLEHLWGVVFDDPAMFGPERMEEAVRRAPWTLARYAAAARSAELRQLAAPASLDCPPLDIAVEDHATSAPLTVQRTAEALDVAADILAVELLLARTALDFQPRRQLGTGVAAALAALEEALAGEDLIVTADAHRAVKRALPRMAERADAAAGYAEGGDPSA
jgi:histidine ammonia-lyase